MPQILVGLILALVVSSFAWAQDWVAYGGDQGGSRYVSVDQITRKTFGDLRGSGPTRPAT